MNDTLIQKEAMIANEWNRMAQQFIGYKPTQTVELAINIAKGLYEIMKDSLTDNGKKQLYQCRYGEFNGKLFPHSLDTDELALAWIFNIRNYVEFKDISTKMFFNKKLIHLNNLKEVVVEPLHYDCSIPGYFEIPELYGRKQRMEIKGKYIEVLFVLYYLIRSEQVGMDICKDCKIKRGNKVNIRLYTECYTIWINGTFNSTKPYEHITIKPNKQVLSRLYKIYDF